MSDAERSQGQGQSKIAKPIESSPADKTISHPPTGVDGAPRRVSDAEAALSPARDGEPPYTVLSRPEKAFVLLMVTLSGLVSPLSSLTYFPALNSLSRDLGVSVGLINLTVTSYMVFQGLAPTFFGDFGDVAGRRPAFIIAMSIYVGANIGLALQGSYAALLVVRCLQSTGSSGTLALTYAVVADVSPRSDRGRYMAYVNVGVNGGIAVGPMVGGVLSQYLGWRAIFWALAVFVGAWLIPYVLLVPETCRNVVGNGSIPPPRAWNVTVVDYVRRRRRGSPDTGPGQQAEKDEAATPKQKTPYPNPLRSLALVLEKDTVLILFYNALLYVAFVDVNTTLSTQFAEIYGFNDLQVGLCYLGFGAGCLISSLVQGSVIDWNYRRIARQLGLPMDSSSRRRVNGNGNGNGNLDGTVTNGGDGGDVDDPYPLELARLQPAVPILATAIIVIAGYGWSLQRRVHVAVPLALQFLIGFCINGFFTVLGVLLLDQHPDAPAKATAANNLVRCSFGALGTAVVDVMIRRLGAGWCFTVLAALPAVTSPLLRLLVRRGPRWRHERRVRRQRRESER